MSMHHKPVLLNEVLTVLAPKANGIYIDGTLGEGGHARALLESSHPNGRLLGLDQDASQIERAKVNLNEFGERAMLIVSPFSEMEHVARKYNITGVDGVLLDLGISSRQLDDASYGLTFSDGSPLDMRLSKSRRSRAADLLNRGNEQEIADVFYLYGDRHNSRTLARKIVNYRRKKPFQVAYDLKAALHVWRPGELAPLFQALRIWVNEEYEELHSVLPQAVRLLKPGGRLAVIAFHSGEDRIVKQFMRANRQLLQVSKQIIIADKSEFQDNPRARSAKLRWAEKQEGTE